ncbi:uncharacterized protein L969DRAFT_105179 [Mixia osmundae IAM 14324]|uniref:Pinin/SDK/MemA protein domain-containing protein n=1 Tax=Mixia osmundae (strain CBS 9802 / IAM 14324 / JCM 22182 / KY 12970) TaxID=764103 RepID=G7DUX9_MIXOS|nr:uncharacterized protein L969DRAFT_105179 [Mixia osmundae IAM 14324]KEI37394.1 hypothetical protein L969DRAFT_105179 [Mixia osmundae IAM 14324]GAA94389.1 hypothetical protein E5Q_01040 [Mixia osmundae IAM 14324]
MAAEVSRRSAEPVLADDDEQVIDLGRSEQAQPEPLAAASDLELGQTAPTEGGTQPAEPLVKRKRVIDDEQSVKRSKRMFGVVMGTLSKFKEDTSKTTKATQKRSDFEQRLADKLRAEAQELAERNERAKRKRILKSAVTAKELEYDLIRAAYTRQNSDLISLAGFLCASAPKASSSERYLLRPAPMPSLPQATVLSSDSVAMYYLPKKLLPAQQEIIDKQKAEAARLVEECRAAWATEDAERSAELEKLKQERSEGLEQIAKEEAAISVKQNKSQKDAGQPVRNPDSAPPVKAEDVSNAIQTDEKSPIDSEKTVGTA